MNMLKRAFGLVGAALLVPAGCVVERPALSTGELQARRSVRLASVAKYSALVNDRLVRRMKRESDAIARGERETFDILVLSGGGDYGAFGAGFLLGWGSVQDPALARPSFDMVTGVSTGALIAPFAFVGTEVSYERIAALYSTPKKEWFVSRGLLKLVFGAESYMDAGGLRKDLEHQVDADTISRIASGESEDRTLWIGTTDLDLGIMYPWDLTEEARRIRAGAARDRFIDVLMASAAIPAIFPPVVIDDTLYVDGGTTTNILYDADLTRPDGPVALFRERHPGVAPPKYRFWVIINNKVGNQERVVQPTWLSITKASVDTAIRSSTLGALKLLESQTRLQRCGGLDVEFRYVAIPDGWRPPNPEAEPFDKELMAALTDLGRAMGADPASWSERLSSEPQLD